MSRSPFRPKPLTLSQKIDRMLNDNRSPSKRKFDLVIAALVIISTGILFVGGFSHALRKLSHRFFSWRGAPTIVEAINSYFWKIPHRLCVPAVSAQ